MVSGTAPADDTSSPNEVEFFGVKLKVKSPHLAALLNSDVNEDVQVIGRRARDAFAREDGRAEQEVERRLQCADASVELRPRSDPDPCAPAAGLDRES